MNGKLLLTLFFLANIWKLYGQSSEYQYTQYTVEDGLPSNECHDVIEDSLGYIWIATDKGLVRFDGYEMKTYGVEKGLKNISCLKLFLDHDQNIWINTYAKKLYKYIPKLDSIVPYEYNEILDSKGHDLWKISDIYVDNNNLYLNTEGIGITIIDKFGVERKPKYNSQCGHYLYKIDEQIFYTTTAGKDNCIELLDNNFLGLEKFLQTIKPKAIYLNPNSYYFSLHPLNYFVENDSLIFHDYENFVDIKKASSGEIYVARIFNKGLIKYRSLEDFKYDEGDILLPNVSATRIFIDSEKNLYVTTTQDGFYSIVTQQMKVFTHSDFSNKQITSIEAVNENLYFVEKEKELYTMNLNTLNTDKLYTSEFSIKGIDNSKGNNLIVSQMPTSFYINKLNNKLNKIRSKINGYHINSKNVEILNDETILVIRPEGFSIYDDISNVPSFLSSERYLGLNILCGNVYRDSIFILGTTNGLRFYHNDSIYSNDSLINISTRINDMEKVGHIFYFATQGSGFYIWDGENPPHQITKKHGLLSNIIKQILVDGNKIYLSGLGGLNVYDAETGEIRTYEKKHGLLSTQINDMVDEGNKIFIATDKGINILDKDQKSYPLIQPIIEEVLINYQNPPRDLSNLKSTENSIEIKYKAIDVKQKGDISYKCILNSSDTIITKNLSITYPALAPNEYTFTVQAQNINGIWGEKTTLKFNVNPPFWRTNMFRATSIGLILVILYMIYHARLKIIQTRLDIQNELVNLEKSALQAQMNPHFIFNCLNSIQNFINKNNRREAMEYLSKFAYLIRQMLEASEHSTVTIERDVEMLTNYLELEQLRANNNFTYEIVVDPSIDPGNTEIPVLMIQPYVENAIKHGVSQVKNGRINVELTKSEGYIIIKIADNGKGFNPNSIGEKSKGMSISNARFDKINKLNKTKLDVKVFSDSNGSIITIKTPFSIK